MHSTARSSMAYVDVTYPTEIYLASFIFQLIAAAHHTMLFLYHIPLVIPIRTCSATRRPSILEILLVILLCTIVIQQWIVCTSRWIPSSTVLSYCHWESKVISTLYGISKCFLYGLLLERVFYVFESSALNFKSSLKWSVRGVVITEAFVIAASLMMLAEGAIESATNYCRLVLPTYLAAGVALSDIFWVMAITIVFCRRLLFLNLQMESVRPIKSVSSSIGSSFDLKSTSMDTIRTNKMSLDSVSTECFTYDMIRKTLVLSMIALLTTPTSIIVGATFGQMDFWVALDYVITSWTVILIFAKHDWIYQHLCQCFEVMVTTKCLSIYSCYCCESCCCCCSNALNDADESTSPVSPMNSITPADHRMAENTAQAGAASANVELT